jgi:hypothetical protein
MHQTTNTKTASYYHNYKMGGAPLVAGVFSVDEVYILMASLFHSHLMVFVIVNKV